jgi:HEAT repeat protein
MKKKSHNEESYNSFDHDGWSEESWSEMMAHDDAGWDDWDDELPLAPTLSLAEVLLQLQNEQEVPSLNELAVFSDLTRAEAEMVQEAWPQIASGHRIKVLTQLVTRSKEDIHLHLGRFLRLALTDPEGSVRRLAVEGLWDDIEPDLLGPLVHILHNDDDTEVRATTAAGLGGFVLAGELEELESAIAMRAEEALLAMLHNQTEPVLVRARALESMAYSGEMGVHQLIEDAYYSPEEEMRVSALTAMGRSADIRWRGYVRAELQSPTAAMRREAAWACGELEAKSALRELLLLLEDDNKEVRLATLYALGNIGGNDAKRALEYFAESDDPDEASVAEQALEEMAFHANAIPLFDETLADDDDWDIELFGVYEDAHEIERGFDTRSSDDLDDDDLDDDMLDHDEMIDDDDSSDDDDISDDDELFSR